MGQQQSKGELVYQQVSYGNAEGIKVLHREGASLEWIDREGKTPLIVACMSPELYDVAKTLIELGANINAYRPGRYAGTPLHHAAKRGLESIVKLLLSHGANPLALNDDCQTALDVARAKGHTNVVRALESHLCLFSGWLREFHGPGFLEVVAPQLVSRKVWAVILPVGSRSLARPYKLELALYSSLQDAQPRAVIALWKANLEEPKLHQSDPSVTIVDNSSKTRIKLGPASDNEKQQLMWFSDACKGIPMARHPAFLQSIPATVPPTVPPAAEDLEMAMAINASLQSAMLERPPLSDTQSSFEGSSSSGQSFPSAPPIIDEIPAHGPIQYPSIDLTPVDMPSPAVEKSPTEEKKDAGSSLCVICLDAPAEGACIPCGHVAGCMPCLNEVKAKEWGCPVCRSKIDQVIKIYHV